MQVTHESILKLISYRFGLGYLNKRHRYASNIGRTLNFEHPKYALPSLPDPAAIAGHALRGAAAGRRPGAARPKPHDLAKLQSSGLLERLGYEVPPPTARSPLPPARRRDEGADRSGPMRPVARWKAWRASTRRRTLLRYVLAFAAGAALTGAVTFAVAAPAFGTPPTARGRRSTPCVRPGSDCRESAPRAPWAPASTPTR